MLLGAFKQYIICSLEKLTVNKKATSYERLLFFASETVKMYVDVLDEPQFYHKYRVGCILSALLSDWKSCKSLKRLRGFESLALRQKMIPMPSGVGIIFFVRIVKKGFVVGAVVNEAPVELQSRE